jgi:DNA-binding beta-propeller fold protein YncE
MLKWLAMRSRILVALLLSSALLDAATEPVRKHGKISGGVERLLYVTNRSGISVYDINDGHTLLRKIDLPDTGDYKGISASVSLGKLYVTSYVKDELVCMDLASDSIDWRRHYSDGYADSQAITPDGKTLYVPLRDGESWWVLDAATGDVKTKIPVTHGKQYAADDHPIGGIGPHNTWMNPDGTRVYMQVLTVPYIYIADTRTNQVIGKVGPFSKGLRPFTVTDDEKLVFANVDWLLGFEVGTARTGDQWGGKMLYRVEAHTPASRLAQIPNPPARKPHSTMSHGINIRPDQKEVWVVDGVYGYVYAYDVTVMPPKHLADVPLFKDPGEQPKPGWLSFSLDGRYVYPDGGAVIDSHTKKVVARIPTSEKLIEIDFRDGKPVKAGHR